MAVKTHLSHGAGVALLLPAVMEYNIPGNPSKYARVAQMMGEDVEGLSVMEAARRSVKAVKDLCMDVGMPRRLRDVGIKKEDIPGFVDYVFTFFPFGLEINPKDLDCEDVVQIYEAAW